MVIATTASVFENVQPLSCGPSCGSTVYVARNVTQNPKKPLGDLMIPTVNSFHTYINIAGNLVVPIAVVHLPAKSGHLPYNGFLIIGPGDDNLRLYRLSTLVQEKGKLPGEELKLLV